MYFIKYNLTQLYIDITAYYKYIGKYVIIYYKYKYVYENYV